MKISALTATLEAAYADLKKVHPELPETNIVVAPTSRAGRNAKLGHWYQGSWREDKKVTHELLLSAEGLQYGAANVFETLVHEAAHALATARKIKDVTGYQYHNKKFKALAEELGLQVEKSGSRGFTATSLPEEVPARWLKWIERLDKQLVGHRAVAPKTSRYSYRQITLACGCGWKIRVGKKFAEQARVICEDCDHKFEAV